MRNRSLIVWLVLGALLLVLLNLPDETSSHVKSGVREGVAPLQSATSGFIRRIKESAWAVHGIRDVLAENEKMSAELQMLRSEVSALKELNRENADLRQVLGFSERSTRQLIPAEVIGRDIGGWWQSIRLGKGQADGIQTGMAVVTPDGLVGKTVDVSLNTADVLLIADRSCKVSGHITRTASYGVLSGDGAPSSGQVICNMDFINKDAPVRPGDAVVTSGLGGILPPGLLIGYIESTVQDESGLYQRADVIPKADLGALSYVFVVTEEASGRAQGAVASQVSLGGMP